MDEWIKMWHIHSLKYYSDPRKKDILPYTITWKKSEDITLSKISQSEKEQYCMIAFWKGV
jgi:hypothetical protein